MSAVAALDAAKLAGVEISVDGVDLRLQADVPPPADVLDQLRQHKAEIVLLITTSWSPDDWLTFYEERAAIREYDGGAVRAEAEAGAMKEMLAELMRRQLQSIGRRPCSAEVGDAGPEPGDAVPAAKRSR